MARYPLHEKKASAWDGGAEHQSIFGSRLFPKSLAIAARPNEFGIWVLGFWTFAGSFMLFYGLCWAGGLFTPLEKHSSRKNGDCEKAP